MRYLRRRAQALRMKGARRTQVALTAFTALGMLGALAGCRPPHADSNAPPLAMVLSGTPGEIYQLHTLTASGTGGSAVRLNQPGATTAAMDAEGRIWVGGRSVHGLPMTSVSVVSADLAEQTRVTTAENPSAGIALADDKAYVAALHNGFGGSVTQVDRATLATRNVSIPPPHGSSYILTAIGANASQVLVAGMVAGPDTRKRYAALTALDAKTLEIVWSSPPLKDTDIWQIVPRGDGFLLLNVASAEDPNPARADVLQLGADHQLSPLALSPAMAAAPLWGQVQGDTLYTYHNRTFNSMSDAPQRALSITDLRSRQSKTVALPDGMDASDIRVAGTHLLLSVKSSTTQHPGGVYAMNLQGENLRLLAAMRDAGKLAAR